MFITGMRTSKHIKLGVYSTSAKKLNNPVICIDLESYAGARARVSFYCQVVSVNLLELYTCILYMYAFACTCIYVYGSTLKISFINC